MPLIVLTGYPCSGKTYRAKQIQGDFESRISQSTDQASKVSILHLPSHHALLDPPSGAEDTRYDTLERSRNPRDQIYNASHAEKTARAEEFSAIKRALSKNNVVIADGLNYIKGFRYQLWCEAKAASTRCVVVHVASREDEVKQWNNQRLESWGWPIKEDGQDETLQRRSAGPKIGRNIIGDLMPESHTAVFGDKVIDYNGGTRSRSSSMGGGTSDGEDEDDNNKVILGLRKPADDTMTLRSLYISDRPDHTSKSTYRPLDTIDLVHETEETSSQDTTPTMPPPSPKASLPYSSATLKSLMMRYEPPSPFTRWDTPLFTVPTSDATPDYTAIWNAIFPPTTNKPLSKKAQSQLSSTTRPPTSQIQTHPPQLGLQFTHASTASTTDHLQSQKPPSSTVEDIKPHAATVLPKPTSSNALQTLETTTASVVKSLLAASRAQNLDSDGGLVTFSVGTPGSAAEPVAAGQANAIELEVVIPPNLLLSQPLLQRLRRKYTQIQRGGIAHGVGHVSGREDVARGFVAFLQAEWDG